MTGNFCDGNGLCYSNEVYYYANRVNDFSCSRETCKMEFNDGTIALFPNKQRRAAASDAEFQNFDGLTVFAGASTKIGQSESKWYSFVNCSNTTFDGRDNIFKPDGKIDTTDHVNVFRPKGRFNVILGENDDVNFYNNSSKFQNRAKLNISGPANISSAGLPSDIF